MTTLHRYITRIAIPFLIVALIAVVIRYTLWSRFVEERVRPSAVGGEALAEPQAAAGPYSEKNRDLLIEQLRRSKETLDRSFAARSASVDDAQRAAVRQSAEELDRSIEQLQSARANSWATSRQDALDRLRAYAERVAGAPPE